MRFLSMLNILRNAPLPKTFGYNRPLLRGLLLKRIFSLYLRFQLSLKTLTYFSHLHKQAVSVLRD